MGADHLPPHRTRRRLLAGVAAEHFNGFADWLRQRGHSARSVRRRLTSLAAWSDWLNETGRTSQELPESLAACAAVVHERPRRKYQFGPNRDTIVATRLYLDYLRVAGLLEQPQTLFEGERHPLLGEFRTWMLEQRGVVLATVKAYTVILSDFVWALGEDPRMYSPRVVRDFAVHRVGRRGRGSVSNNCTAVRAFLRFLGATGRCTSGMEAILPAVASQADARVPHHLSPAEIELLLASVSRERIGLRDRAMLLLLARLGLRAGDVVHLRLHDIDFREGTVCVSGKGRRADVLPLPQDVGDAIVAYLRRARPRTLVPEVFLTSRAPFKKLTPPTLSTIVARTMGRAGLHAPTRGCHLLRHSAATNMLRHGATLAGVGAVLRHRRPATTVIYAKADDRRLAAVAQPWPEGAPC
jgi:site-specific recombinase XerD